jgi:hypothetical protein
MRRVRFESPTAGCGDAGTDSGERQVPCFSGAVLAVLVARLEDLVGR